MELTDAQLRAARDIRDVASLALGLADQLTGAATRGEALAVLLGLIGQGGTLRDEAAELYALVDAGEDG